MDRVVLGRDATLVEPASIVGKGAVGAVRLAHFGSRQAAAKYNLLLAGEGGPVSSVQRADLSRMFNEEAELLARATGHRGIAKFLGCAMDPAHPGEVQYIFTELYCSSLSQLLHVEDRKLSDLEIEKIMCDVACGLRHMHALGVTHRDFSSRNVLVDADLRAYICDFGQAKVLRGRNRGPGHLFSQTRDSLQPGAPDICAPETYIEHGVVTSRMDVFSFGVVLMEVCLGLPPAPRPKLSWRDGAHVVLTEVERRADHIELMRTDRLPRHVALACLADDAADRPNARVLAAAFETLCGDVTGDAAYAAVSADSHASLVQIAAWIVNERERARVAALVEAARVEAELEAARLEAARVEAARVEAARVEAVLSLRGSLRGGPELIVPKGQGHFTYGYACTVDCDDVFVPDGSRKCVAVYDGDGRLVRRIGAGELCDPRGCAVVGDAVFVAEAQACCVAAYPRASGARRHVFGSAGTGAGQLRSPFGVAAWDKRVLVTELGNERISVFSEDGSFVGHAGSSAGLHQLRDPEGICVSGDLRYPEGICVSGDEVFVSSWHHLEAQIAVCRASGRGVLALERYIGAGELRRAKDVAVGRGLLCVSDEPRQCVVLFDAASGRLVGGVDDFGAAVWGVALRQDGVLFVTTAEHELYRVQLE